MKEISVLLVDNNPLFAQLLVRFLQLEGRARVTVANSAQEDVLTIAGLVNPDAVLFDLDALGKAGLELIRRIRDILPDGLLIATMDDLDCREAVVDAGADSLMLKSELDLNFLVKVHTWIKRHRRLPRTMRPIQTSYRTPQPN